MSSDAELPTLPLAGGELDPDRGTATYGRFRSLGVIGRGGMGVVLRAHDPELGRDVALKLLAPGAFGQLDAEARRLLQREAQAMARLAHPNVVAVYEMGQIGAERFIAMELVEGTTLRRWMTDRPRPWREIVAVFVGCGRGLAAAHAAGMIHRDFKPENVLMGADERPRVTDFGLVSHVVEAGTGAVVGTPMYMAPEQWTGEELDARADQFAFCVALWEALYGARPFAGGSASEMRDRVLAGERPPVPSGSPVDGRLEEILCRGLARQPSARWPGMEPLLAALGALGAPGATPRRAPWIAGGLALAGAIALIVVLGRARPSADPCPDPAPRLAGTWDAATRARLATRFPQAAAQLDDYAAGWRTAGLAACRATRVEGTQSVALFEARTRCLEARRVELAAFTAALAAAEAATPSSAAAAADALDDLESCAEREQLLAFPPPADPTRRAALDELDRTLVDVGTERWRVSPATRLAHAAEVLRQARVLAYPPLLVRALRVHQDAAEASGDLDGAESSLRELSAYTAEVRDVGGSARAWSALLELLIRRHKLEEARILTSVAEAAVVRAGNLPALRDRLTAAQRHLAAAAAQRPGGLATP